MSTSLTLDPGLSAEAAPIARTAAQCVVRLQRLLWLVVGIGRHLGMATNLAAANQVGRMLGEAPFVAGPRAAWGAAEQDAAGQDVDVRRVWALLERAARWTRTLHARLAGQGVAALMARPVAPKPAEAAMAPLAEPPERPERREAPERRETFDFATGLAGPMSRAARRQPVAAVVARIFADLDRATALLKDAEAAKRLLAVATEIRRLVAAALAWLAGGRSARGAGRAMADEGSMGWAGGQRPPRAPPDG